MEINCLKEFPGKKGGCEEGEEILALEKKEKRGGEETLCRWRKKNWDVGLRDNALELQRGGLKEERDPSE